MNRDWEELCERYFERTLSPAETRLLTQKLKSDAQARRLFVRTSYEWCMLGIVLKELECEGGEALPSRTLREGRRLSAGWLVTAAAAAAILAAIVWRPVLERLGEGPAARATAAASGVRCRAAVGGWRELRAGDEVRDGTRIETGKAGRATLVYDGGQAEVDVFEGAALTVLRLERGKDQVVMERGRIEAQVAHADSGTPFSVLTPHARVEVKGSRLMLMVDSKTSRLEVLEGLVGLTRLADNMSVDVAAGQFAVAGEGVELAARPMAPSSDMGTGKDRAPQPSSHLYGKTLFEDEFETLGNWDIVMRKPDGSWAEASPELAKYVSIRQRDSDILLQNKGEEVRSAVFINTNKRAGGMPDVTLGIRSKFQVKSERFVVEAYTIVYDVGLGQGSELVAGGVEAIEETQLRAGWAVIPPAWSRHAYEFVPSAKGGPDGYIRRHFATVLPFPGRSIPEKRATYWFGEWRVRLAEGRRIIIGSRNASVFVHRVRVREIEDDGISVAKGE